MTFYVTYATRMHNNREYNIMPHAVKIETDDAENARIKFHNIFLQCFGQDLQYRILNISTQKGLTIKT